MDGQASPWLISASGFYHTAYKSYYRRAIDFSKDAVKMPIGTLGVGGHVCMATATVDVSIHYHIIVFLLTPFHMSLHTLTGIIQEHKRANGMASCFVKSTPPATVWDFLLVGIEQ